MATLLFLAAGIGVLSNFTFNIEQVGYKLNAGMHMLCRNGTSTIKIPKSAVEQTKDAGEVTIGGELYDVKDSYIIGDSVVMTVRKDPGEQDNITKFLSCFQVETHPAERDGHHFSKYKPYTTDVKILPQLSDIQFVYESCLTLQFHYLAPILGLLLWQDVVKPPPDNTLV